MRGGGAASSARLLLCLLSAGGVAPATELVFHVPDVLVRHEAAPDRPVGTGVTRHDKVDGRRASARRENRGHHEGLHYEEFFVEHEISALDAKAASSDLHVEDIPARAPGCGICSREELAYCEWQVVADHCCCERRYQEPYPWIPHTCYAGPKSCQPIARDCGFYRRLRDCCCDRRLAEKWKAILSSAGALRPLLLPLVVTTLLVPVLLRIQTL